MKLTTMLTAVAALTAGANAQNFYLENTQDVGILCDYVNTPGFFIGNNPSVIALDGDRLFVAGYNNSGAAANLKLVKIESIFGTRAFRLFNLNTDPAGTPIYDINIPAQRSFYGMTYSAGAGVLVSYDSGGVGSAGAYRLFDVDSQLNPILVTTSPSGLSARGGAGSAWDYGFDGLGFDYNGDGTKDGPLAAIMDFASYPGGVQAKGPFGILARESAPGAGDGLNMFAGRKYDGNSVDALSNSAAPIMNGFDATGNKVQGTIWRDIDIHPTNGNVACRASNDVVIGVRNASNGLSSLALVDNSGAAGTGDPYAFQIMQRCEWITGGASDFVIYNLYGAAANSPISTWAKGASVSGAPVALGFFNSDGTEFTATSPSGLMDFSWDAANQRLAICDFAARKVYIFGVNPPAPACAWAGDGCYADYTNDGGIDGDDVIAFFSAWDAADNCADVDASGGVDGDDVITFFSAWDAAGTGFPGC
jgi:hypothetical protein